MRKSKVIAIANQKGGVGKTTTAIALAAGLRKKGFKVLIVDVDDSNPSLTKFLGAEPTRLETTLTDLMLNILFDKSIETQAKEVVLMNEEGLEFIPADKNLAGITTFLNNTSDAGKKNGVLKSVLAAFDDKYDYIILDAAPALNAMSLNVLAAADEVIIVTQPQGAAELGICELQSTIANIRREINTELIVKGILITMVDNRTKYNRSKTEAIENSEYSELAMKVFANKIPREIKAEEYVESGKSILGYAPDSKSARAYVAFVEEYLQG